MLEVHATPLLQAAIALLLLLFLWWLIIERAFKTPSTTKQTTIAPNTSAQQKFDNTSTHIKSSGTVSSELAPDKLVANKQQSESDTTDVDRQTKNGQPLSGNTAGPRNTTDHSHAHYPDTTTRTEKSKSSKQDLQSKKAAPPATAKPETKNQPTSKSAARSTFKDIANSTSVEPTATADAFPDKARKAFDKSTVAADTTGNKKTDKTTQKTAGKTNHTNECSTAVHNQKVIGTSTVTDQQTAATKADRVKPQPPQIQREKPSTPQAIEHASTQQSARRSSDSAKPSKSPESPENRQTKSTKSTKSTKKNLQHPTTPGTAQHLLTNAQPKSAALTQPGRTELAPKPQSSNKQQAPHSGDTQSTKDANAATQPTITAVVHVDAKGSYSSADSQKKNTTSTEKYQTAAKAKRPSVSSEASIQIPTSAGSRHTRNENPQPHALLDSNNPVPHIKDKASLSAHTKTGAQSHRSPEEQSHEARQSYKNKQGHKEKQTQKAQGSTPNVSPINIAAAAKESTQRNAGLKHGPKTPSALKPHPDKSVDRKQSAIEIVVSRQSAPSTPIEAPSEHASSDQTHSKQASDKTPQLTNTDPTANSNHRSPGLTTTDKIEDTAREKTIEANAVAEVSAAANADAVLRAQLAASEDRIKRLQSTLNNLQHNTAPSAHTETTAVTHNRPTLLSKVRILDHPKS